MYASAAEILNDSLRLSCHARQNEETASIARRLHAHRAFDSAGHHRSHRRGVLVGQNLIAAAGVRATISQIEKYNTAVNTFRSKYDCLPGDCANAANFGFAARGAASGEGDGNGIIQGIGAFPGCTSSNGEAALFWEDLSTAHLIDGGFSSATATTNASGAIGNYFPTAKLGQGNYIYVWSGGPGGWNADGVGETVPTISAFQLSVLSVQLLIRRRGLSVAQAYTIDGKIDDGLPQSGNVIASYNTWSAPSGCLGWSAGGGAFGAGGVGATPGSATTCYDNGNVGGATQQYSVEQSGGSNINCALSFRFQ